MMSFDKWTDLFAFVLLPACILMFFAWKEKKRRTVYGLLVLSLCMIIIAACLH